MGIITFYSYKGGVGRTMALANVAWILASNGHRVLAVDWNLESPGLQRYFHPFMVDKELRTSTGVIDMIRDYATATLDPVQTDDPHWYVGYARTSRHASSLEWLFPSYGQLDLLSSGQQNVAYAAAVATFDWANFYSRLGGGGFLQAMRAEMRERYDYVLIDCPSGTGDVASICTVALPDVVVNCFTFSTQSIDGVAATAHSMAVQRPAADPIRLLPVAMRVEAEAEPLKLDAARELTRIKFAPYRCEVEIPYKPFYAFEETLAVFGDRPGHEGTLLRAYERLAALISDGAVTAMPHIEERLRRRRLTEFGPLQPDPPLHFVIGYASADQVWADWITSLIAKPHSYLTLDFERTPLEECLRQIDAATRVLLLISHDFVRSDAVQALWAEATRRISDLDRFFVGVRVGSGRLSPPFDRLPAVDIIGTDERGARNLVLREVSPSGAKLVISGSGPRYPNAPVPVTNLPQRNPIFTGRASILDELRFTLTSEGPVAPQVLHGMSAVGKTQVALEYAYRYAAYYDVIWWIPAEQIGLVRAGLVSLAEHLSLPGGENVEDNVLAVFEALRNGEPYSQWLLIFDNAGDPAELRRYLPAGTGHVLLTSRDRIWLHRGDVHAFELDVFIRAESVALLRKKLPHAPEAKLHHVAEKLGDLPLAIEQAGAWLAATGMPVEHYLALLDTHLIEILEEDLPSGYQRPVATTWRMALDQLRAENSAAAKLLEICAFFSVEPIPLSMITGAKSQRIIDALLRFDPMLRDPIIRARMIRDIGRFALARIDNATPSIQLHRLIQAVIRAVLSPQEVHENRRIAQEALAAANPKDPDDSRNWPAYREIRAHLVQPEALDSPDRDVRQLVLDLVRFLYRLSDYAGSLELAEAAFSRWQDMPDGADDPQTLLLRCHIATAMRSYGRSAEALVISRDVWRRMREKLGPEHVYTITAFSGVAADLRAVGDYAEALRVQQQTYDLCRNELGDDAERTLMAANNLAVSLRLTGDFAAARRLDEATLDKRRALLPEGSWYTLASANNLARDLYEIGDYEGAYKLLDRTLAEFRRVFGERFTETQRTARNFAVTLRKLGRLREAFDLSSSTLRALTELHGPRHPETLACAGNLAADYSALGADVTAYEHAGEVYEQHRSALGDRHPFTFGAAGNLAVYAWKVGRVESAARLCGEAVQGLRELLGPDHPYTLIVTVNLANIEFARGNHDEAFTLDSQTHQRLSAALGVDHPDALVAQSNLAISAFAVGRASAPEIHADVLARALRVLGTRHPHRVAIESGQRLGCDFDPPSP